MKIPCMLKHGLVAAKSATNWVRNQLDTPILVLIYHRVTTLYHDPQLLAVAPANFRAHLRYLKANHPIVRFEDDWSTITEPSIAITFDDGYADNAIEALPIIEEAGVPVTFFVSTGNLSTQREFWWDELERLILVHTARPETFELHDNRYGRSWFVRTDFERETLYREMHPLMKRVDHQLREEWMGQLRTWAGMDVQGRESYRSMNNDELRQLAASEWVTIGAHTILHDPLSVLNYEQQRHEILTSRNDLVSLTGKEIKVFSYPFGGKCDYTTDSVKICREAGFIRVASNFAGQVHRWTDPYQVPRQLVRNWDVSQFAEHIKRFWLI